MSWYEERFQFNFPTTIRFGKGVVEEIGPHLKEKGLKKPLVLTDAILKDLAPCTRLVQELEKSGLSAPMFYDIDKNPVFKNVEDGAKFFKENNCDSIIGLGGGASMDVARAVAMRINHDGPLADYIEENGGDQKIINPIPYFVTVPTTSGTGSEVGRSSVISDDETHEKKIFFHPNLLASRVFADPELTMELPASVTATTGMDALTHNVEAYLAKGFHPMCDGIALEGIRLISESIENAVNQPDLEARTKMMAAATMGAVAFQKGLGIVHSMAHSLSTHFNMHHGLANAIMLPIGLMFNQEHCGDRFQSMAQAVGTLDFIGYVQKLNRTLGIKEKLSEHGISAEDIEKLSQTAFQDVCHQCNPVPVTLENFKELYQKAL